MSWIKLTDLPEQRLPMTDDTAKSFWEIQDGRIVHQGRANRGTDVESFELLEGSDFIARDKRCIYHAWSTLKSIDRDSFEPLGNGYFKEKALGYCEHETSLKPLKGNMVESLEALGNSYARDANFAYYGGRVIAACTSPMTLKVVPQTGEHPIFAARDEAHCYYEGAQLKGADPATWGMIEKGFSKDANSVYREPIRRVCILT